jgi:hypothetical protein
VTDPPRAVLDSSVLVPAWSRLLLSTLAATRPALYTPVWCEWIIAETWRVLPVQRLRGRSALTAADERQLSMSANIMLTALLQVMTFVSVIPPFDAAWAGFGDAAAVRAEARFVVSPNLRDVPPRGADGLCAHAGIEFITAESFVSDILGLDATLVAPTPIPGTGHIAHRRRT